MKANEFVKKYGINDAKCCILNCASPEDRWLMRRGDLISDDAFDDLKRLVESHELVMQFGSLEEAKRNSENPNWLPDDNTGLLLELDRAIADVESCQ